MPSFNYVAVTAAGEETTGAIDAATEADATSILRNQGLYPTRIGAPGAAAGAKPTKARARKRKRGGGTIKSKVLMIFTRQLATLIDSGLPLLRGLTVLGKQEPNPVLRRTINGLADGVQTGSTFSESLAQHPKIFNKLYVNMVKAGELGGVLEISLERLAQYQEKAQKLKSKIVAAMIYPLIVMVIASVIMVFLLTVIVPKFETIFEEMLPGGKDDMPALTKTVMGASDWLLSQWLPILIIIVLIIAGYKGFVSTKGGRKFIDRLKLNIPLFGNVQRKSAISRFSRTLGTLVTSGVPILQALQITRETAGNVVVSEAIDNVHDAVREGDSIVAPMEESGVFPSMVISMVDVGEETGQLPDMLLKIADVYDDEVDSAVGALTAMMEPIMIVVLAAVVGTIVLALFMPLVKIIEGMSAGQ
jgi:type IV pilus assembly protein PilC